MTHYVIETSFNARVEINESEINPYEKSSNIYFTSAEAKVAYIKRLKQLSDELIAEIEYIEKSNSIDTLPLLLRSQHGLNNKDLDDYHNTTTFGGITF